ncbi:MULTISPECIES: 30S ribosomal protein S7 [unclassified Meiothermus]|uniref:30S ribosomal protein S7 n=1 Tax=unclassified Meiothermus TaxID=370471 RepID=UPI000D7BA85C|nr:MULTISPECIES: 30S ribosomal protein S7 [unclassified Meiothermus]PZA06438.1 30S ribosomal protein S7 [Meiothermus sp. Pnk-1]RYM36943.1 30S ribosomal protein S7 [Meiothermus sp. PNK-Is4]
MSRRRQAEVRPLSPDLVYGDVVVSAFINRIMREGKKNLAARIFYDACKIIQDKSGQEPLKVFRQAVDNVRPRVEVRSRRVGGANYQVPVEVSPRRQQTLALRWIANAAEGRSERGAAARLAAELLEAAEGKGGAVKKKEDVERMAEANRAYAHYRW